MLVLRRRAVLVLALLLVGANLRIAVASVPPVLDAIQADTGLSSTGAAG